MLFDTDVIIWSFRGNRRAASQIDACLERFVSAVSYMELLQGSRNRMDQELTRQFIFELGFQILPITENISHRAMIYMEEFTLQSGMKLADALIAATAAENGCELCTGNHKHYRIIPGLQLSVFKP